MKLSIKIACLVGLFVGAGAVHAASLYQAIDTGDVTRVQEILTGDATLANGDANFVLETKSLLKTPLHLAVEKGHHEIVAALVAAGADANKKCRHTDEGSISDHTPLADAVNDNKLACIQELLKSSTINVNLGSETPLGDIVIHVSPLTAAVSNENLDIVRILCADKRTDLNSKTLLGCSPLHLTDNFDIIDTLLTHGANPDAQDNDGETPLFRARSAEVAQRLITGKANPNAINHARLTALQHAVKENRVAVVGEMLKADGLNVNATDMTGRTALHFAQSPEVVTMLVGAGANIALNSIAIDEITPLDYHLKNKPNATTIEAFAQAGIQISDKNFDGEPNIVRALYGDNIDVIRALLKVKNIKNFLDRKECKNGSTPLMAAINAKRTDIAQLLVESGADITKGIAGGNMLHYAAHAGHAEIIPALKKAGLDVNQEHNGFGTKDTALSIAVKNNNLAMVTALLDAGADVTLPTGSYNSTPLHLAKNFPEMRELLIQRGANINAQDGAGYTPLARAVESGSKEAIQFFVTQGARTDIKTKTGNQTVFDLAQDKPELQQALRAPTPSNPKTPKPTTPPTQNPTRNPTNNNPGTPNPQDNPDVADLRETFFGVNKNIVRGGLLVATVVAALKNWSAFTEAKKYIRAKNKAAAARNETALIGNESELNQRAFKRLCKKHPAAVALFLGSGIGTITSCVM